MTAVIRAASGTGPSRPPTETSLTRRLVRLIRSRPVTQADLDRTAELTLDAVANAVGGGRSAAGRILLDWGRTAAADAGRRACVVGGLTHILEMDDIHRASVVHTGCVTVPAAFAVARGRDISGERLLRAILYGFEAATRVGMAVGPGHYEIWHNTATCGPFGSAMTAATLLELDDDATVHALGNAGTQSAGLWEFLATGAMSKHLHAGRAAEAGVVAAELAARGFTGPPTILEGRAGFFAATCPDPDPMAVLRNPDAPWQVHRTSIKPWPSCRHTHAAIDAALALSESIDIESIAAVSVATYAAAAHVCDRPVATSEYEAKFSLQHCVAAALMRRRVDFEAFDERARSEVALLAERVQVAIAEPYASDYPEAWGAEVGVALRDGTRRSVVRRACRGDPSAPLGTGELIDKARDLLRFGGAPDPDALIEAVLSLARGADVPDVEAYINSCQVT